MSLPAWHPSHPSTDQFLPKSVQLVKPMFQPQLDIINKSANDEEELNVTKSSFGDAGVAKIEEVSNSDEDSGNSSANSSANEDAKKNLQFQVVFNQIPVVWSLFESSLVGFKKFFDHEFFSTGIIDVR